MFKLRKLIKDLTPYNLIDKLKEILFRIVVEVEILKETGGSTEHLEKEIEELKAKNTLQDNKLSGIEKVDAAQDKTLNIHSTDISKLKEKDVDQDSRIEKLESNSSEVKVDNKTITLSSKGELQLGKSHPELPDDKYRYLDLEGLSIGESFIGPNYGILMSSDEGGEFNMSYNKLSVSVNDPNSPGEKLNYFLVNYSNGLELHTSNGNRMGLNPGGIEYYKGEKRRLLYFPDHNSENTPSIPVSVNGIVADRSGNIVIPVGSGSELKGFKNFENDKGFVLQGSYDEFTNSVIRFGEEDKPQYSELSEEGIYVEDLNEYYGIIETSSLNPGRLEIMGSTTNDVGEQEQNRVYINSKYVGVIDSKDQSTSLESRKIRFQKEGRTEMLIEPESISMLDKVTGELVEITVENGVLVVK